MWNSTFKPRKKSLRDAWAEKQRGKACAWPRRDSAVGRHPERQGQKQATARARAPLKKQSAKARALIPGRRACIAAVRARSGGRCEIRIEGCCIGASSDVHEILARSAGGSITDPANCLDSCRPCHEFVTENANRARELGFIAPRGA